MKTNRSQHIQTDKPVIAHAGPTEPRPLSGPFSNLVDLITLGNRGIALTFLLQYLGYTERPERLEAVYEANSAAIDRYLEYVDVDKLAKAMLGGPNKDVPWYKNQYVLGGIGAGALGLWLIKKIL